MRSKWGIAISRFSGWIKTEWPTHALQILGISLVVSGLWWLLARYPINDFVNQVLSSQELTGGAAPILAVGAMVAGILVFSFSHRRRLVKARLFVATVWMCIAAIMVFALGWFTIGYFINGSWAWELSSEETKRIDAVRIILTMVAGVGGIVLLTISYRKQRGAEEADFMNRLENAARQLGALEPTVQFAGIYALAAIADDESSKERKQQCVDVLCGYMRLPYAGDGAPSLLREVVQKYTRTYERGCMEETRTHQLRPADKEVRLTIIRTITEHLRKGARNPWWGLKLDFTGAVFDGGDFTGAIFSNAVVKFTDVKFRGGTVNFQGARFEGGKVSFEDARFEGGDVSFEDARFEGGTVSFVGARFEGGDVRFWGARFEGGDVRFWGARFEGGDVSFLGARFEGGDVSFLAARFEGGNVFFWEARFEGGDVSFLGARFEGGTVSFVGARFEGGTVDFGRARFEGGTVDFSNITITETACLDFANPRSWDTPPQVPWQGGESPLGILPRSWPPVLDEE